MPSLDGKYEAQAVLHQRDFLTTYQATSPEGAGKIYWFEVHDPKAREAFYRYRNAIKQLISLGAIADVEVSSKPGYYYIFWPITKGSPVSSNESSKRSQNLEQIRGALAQHGYTLEDVELKSKGSRLIVSDLDPLAQHSPSEVASQIPDPPAPPGKGWRGWLPGLLLFFLAAWSLGQGVYRYMNPPQYLVPELRGMTTDQVKTTLKDLDLEVVFQTASDPSRPTGVILDQDPRPNTQVKAGRRLELALNQPRQGAVPTVLGLTLVEAEQSIDAAGYQVGAAHEVYGQEAPDSVIATAPPPGSTLPLGGKIEVLVSAGPPPPSTIVPDLRGLTVEQARFLITTAGLNLGEVVEVAANSPAGIVIEQTPSPGIVASGVTAQVTVAAQPQVFLPPPRPAVRAQPAPKREPEPETPPQSESVSTDEPEPQAAVAPPATPRNVPLQIQLPDSLVGQEVRLLVRDQEGIRVLYDGPTQSGWRMEGEVPVVGQATFRLFVGGQLFQEWTF